MQESSRTSFRRLAMEASPVRNKSPSASRAPPSTVAKRWQHTAPERHLQRQHGGHASRRGEAVRLHGKIASARLPEAQLILLKNERFQHTRTGRHHGTHDPFAAFTI